MKQRCPRCLHLRQPDAKAPDWQCPACGIAYAKAYEEAPVAGRSQASVRPHRVSQDGGGLLGSWVFKALIAIAVVLAVGTSQRWFSIVHPVHRTPSGPSTPSAPVDIAIYTTSTCGYCHQAMAYMDQRHIAYTEYDIERDPARFREFRKLGGQGTPLIVVGDEILHGFEAGMLQDAIDRSAGR